MIGQKNLLTKINKYTIDNFPRSVLLIGEYGCGKHTLAQHISANILKLPLIDISENISDEVIDNIYMSSLPAVYLIDSGKFLFDKEQNILLKFIEEPLKNAYIIILSESKNSLLDTVLNRCISFEFEQYTKDELNDFVKDEVNKELILKYVKTPGRIINSNLSNIADLLKVCETMATSLNRANFATTLTIADKINYKDEFNKFDLSLFLNVLSETLFKHYLNTNDKNTLKMFEITGEQRKILSDKRINKELFMQNLLIKLWRQSRA